MLIALSAIRLLRSSNFMIDKVIKPHRWFLAVRLFFLPFRPYIYYNGWGIYFQDNMVNFLRDWALNLMIHSCFQNQHP